jgi:hypothetical protein
MKPKQRERVTMRKFGFIDKLLFKFGRRKVFEAGISKTGSFTLTGHLNHTGGITVASPEKILYTPHNVYGVEGIVFSMRKGSLISETKDNITCIWQVIAFIEPRTIYARRIAICK